MQKTLRLIQGGRAPIRVFGSVRVDVLPIERIDRQTHEIMVFEEDTNLILTIDRRVHYREEHPVRLMTSLMQSRKHQVGSIVRNDRSWYAVVIDIEAEPCCKNQWVEQAYAHLVASLRDSTISSAALTLLGHMYGNIGLNEALRMFKQFIMHEQPHLKRLSLVVPASSLEATKTALAAGL